MDIGLIPRKNWYCHPRIHDVLTRLPDTFVSPTWTQLPSFLRPKYALRFYWIWFKNRIVDRLQMLAFKMSSSRGKRWWNRSMRIDRSLLGPLTEQLHRKMYKALARGDAEELRDICLGGVFQKHCSLIASRKPTETYEWTCKLLKTPRVVSDKGVRLSDDGTMLRQAVVKMRTRQRLTKKVDGKLAKGTGKDVDITEYVVLQSIYELWEPRPWKVWGTTSVTSLESYDDGYQRFLDAEVKSRERRA